jgi:hypothetical protein
MSTKKTDKNLSVLNNEDFSSTLLVEQTPEEVFAAITNVRGWWTGEIEGNTDKLNDEFSYRYEDIHYSKQRLTEVTPGRKVVWLVIDSHLNFIKETDEWNGTEIIFEISKQGDKTKLVFSHKGLVPPVACYDKCAPAWTYYIQDSLFKLIAS